MSLAQLLARGAMQSMTLSQRRQALADGLFYHGGVPGLTVGDLIQPRCKTGVLPTGALARRLGASKGDAPYGWPDPPDVVSITVNPRLAALYARGVRYPRGGRYPTGGDLYRVEPVGTLVEDERRAVLWPCMCFFAPAALVLEVVELRPRKVPERPRTAAQS